jgi:hypothetical protein
VRPCVYHLQYLLGYGLPCHCETAPHIDMQVGAGCWGGGVPYPKLGRGRGRGGGGGVQDGELELVGGPCSVKTRG